MLTQKRCSRKNQVLIRDHGYKPDITPDSQDLNMCKYEIEETPEKDFSTLHETRALSLRPQNTISCFHDYLRNDMIPRAPKRRPQIRYIFVTKRYLIQDGDLSGGATLTKKPQTLSPL